MYSQTLILLSILIFSLSGVGLGFAISEGNIFSYIRDIFKYKIKIDILTDLINCSQCTSFYCGILSFLLGYFSLGGLLSVRISILSIMCGLISSFIAVFTSGIRR